MNKVRMKTTEEKGATVHTFDFAYVDRNQEMRWHEKAVVARKVKEEWTFSFKQIKGLTTLEFGSYKNLLDRVDQIRETNAMNKMGIDIDHSA